MQEGRIKNLQYFPKPKCSGPDPASLLACNNTLLCKYPVEIKWDYSQGKVLPHMSKSGRLCPISEVLERSNLVWAVKWGKNLAKTIGKTKYLGILHVNWFYVQNTQVLHKNEQM